MVRVEDSDVPQIAIVKLWGAVVLHGIVSCDAQGVLLVPLRHQQKWKAPFFYSAIESLSDK